MPEIGGIPPCSIWPASPSRNEVPTTNRTRCRNASKGELTLCKSSRGVLRRQLRSISGSAGALSGRTSAELWQRQAVLEGVMAPPPTSPAVGSGSYPKYMDGGSRCAARVAGASVGLFCFLIFGDRPKLTGKLSAKRRFAQSAHHPFERCSPLPKLGRCHTVALLPGVAGGCRMSMSHFLLIRPGLNPRYPRSSGCPAGEGWMRVAGASV